MGLTSLRVRVGNPTPPRVKEEIAFLDLQLVSGAPDGT